MLEATLDADPEDVNDLGDSFEILSDPTDIVPVRTAVQAAGLDYDSAEVSFVPEYTQEVDAPTAEKLMRIIEALEDSDDVQNVYANFDAPTRCWPPSADAAPGGPTTPVVSRCVSVGHLGRSARLALRTSVRSARYRPDSRRCRSAGARHRSRV